MLIRLQGVSKTFQKKQVLRNICLGVREGEIFGLIGPSGSGKTTLIRLIIGALRPDTGTVTVAGRRIPDFPVLSEIGYMPQNDALYSDLTGMQNLRFFGGMYGLSGRALQQRCAQTLEFVGLTQDAGRRVAEYSGGMKKRLSLAVALLHSPRLLILDEPTVGIDPILRRKIWDEFRTLLTQGKTILVSTHVMDEAERCDRLGLVYGGEILACGGVDELRRQAGGLIENLFLQTKGGS